MTVEQYLQRLRALGSDKRKPTPRTVRAFQTLVLGFYREHRRTFAWRRTRDPYRILVSEIMLQQTQTVRVAERFGAFIQQFPTVRELARAPQSEVIRAWQGLGYYRRARNLHRAAIAICEHHGGKVPRNPADLKALPGVGAYTAAAVAAFAFNTPVPMIETNIRSVYLFAFCRGRRAVSDKELLALVAQTIPTGATQHALPVHGRIWFYALMDLGVELKRLRAGINHASKHHARQSPFKGSDREVAAQVLKLIVSRKRPTAESELCETLSAAPAMITKAVNRLVKDSLIKRLKSGRLSPLC
jgi:A/G-specific adenine glycosylase